MADAVYTNARNTLLGGGVHGQTDWDTDNLKIGLRDEATTAISLAHQDLADVSSAHVDTTANLTADVGVAATGAWDFTNDTDRPRIHLIIDRAVVAHEGKGDFVDGGSPTDTT